jgi:hypothetical protein
MNIFANQLSPCSSSAPAERVSLVHVCSGAKGPASSTKNKIWVRPCSPDAGVSARAGNRRFWLLSALCTHTRAP